MCVMCARAGLAAKCIVCDARVRLPLLDVPYCYFWDP